MFTGIVQSVGRIVNVDPIRLEGGSPSGGRRVRIEARALGLDDVRIGDSIAIDGACMTVVDRTAVTFDVDVSAESLARTATFEPGREVNLEKAARIGDRLDGHLVLGHVDGTGVVRSMLAVGESWELVVRAPTALARYIAPKGSIAIDGVSLTVNRLDDHPDGCDFSINLIPHTYAVTALRRLSAGMPVNLEVDPIARYCDRLLTFAR